MLGLVGRPARRTAVSRRTVALTGAAAGFLTALGAILGPPGQAAYYVVAVLMKLFAGARAGADGGEDGDRRGHSASRAAGAAWAKRAIRSEPQRREAEAAVAVPRHPTTVAQAPPEVDRGRLGEVLRRAADLADAEAAPEDLREHLVVEDEVVGVLRRAGARARTSRENAR